MKLRTMLLLMLLTLALVLGLFAPIQAKADESSRFDLKDLSGKTVILHTNDIHGRVDQGIDNSVGISAVAALKKICIANGAEVLLLDAGDTFHGKPIATIDKGETIATLMNACGYDAMALGNHDYNYGWNHVLELEKKLNFPILASNVVKEKDKTPFVKNHIIIEKNGIKYGIFGLSTMETVTKTNPNNVVGLTFFDPVKQAKTEVQQLKSEGAELIIGLGHIGIDESSIPTSVDLLNEVNGIDLFIDGHSHSTLQSCIEKNDSKTLLVSDGQYLNTIGCVVIDSDKKMTPYSLDVNALKTMNIRVELLEDETAASVDTKVGNVLVEANEKMSESLKEVVGTTTIRLDGDRENVRTSETNLGNLAADAIRWAANTQIAMTNGGGIRTSIEVGDITKGMLSEVFPFGNIIVSKKVTGQAIKDMLEHGVKDYPAASGGFPQTSGMTFTINANQDPGNRISDLKIGGKTMDPKAMYTLSSNDFTIAGGDGYTMIGNDAFPTLFEYGALDEALIAYLKTNPSTESYAVGRTTVIGVGESETKGTDEAIVMDEKEEIPTVADVVTTYTVTKGDYLRKIAKRLYGNESMWKQIYEWNKDKIQNPDYIQIGWELVLLSE
ncbi:MAG: 5'-nucleotidase C-terminal domain-containing protein [Clostridiales bacterium]|nr:5'-nucleotidase C-terminal domain-containing protein [Clostridiales bacterium]